MKKVSKLAKYKCCAMISAGDVAASDLDIFVSEENPGLPTHIDPQRQGLEVSAWSISELVVSVQPVACDDCKVVNSTQPLQCHFQLKAN